MTTDAAPRVSVLLPAGEGAPRPSEAAARVLDERDVALELIVIHDGSVPDEGSALAARDPARVRVVAHPAQGVARALGLGLALARGEWLVALSPHERLVPGRIGERLRLLRQSEDLVGAIGPAPGDDTGALLDRLFAAVPPAGGDALLRVEAARAVGGWDPTLRFAHPLDLWLRLLGRGRLLACSTSLVVEPSRRRLPGEVEPEASRLERASVLSAALTSLRSEQLAPDDRDPGASARRLARVASATGLAELHPLATELLREAASAGGGADAERAALVEVTRPEPWLRVALEVQSLDRGGLENVVADLALGLGDEGIRPVVVCTERGGARADELRAAGVEVFVLRAGDRTRELGELLDARSIDLLNPHFSTRGTRAAAVRGIPVVATLHNAYAWVGASVLDEIRAVDPWVAGYTAVSRFVADFSAARFAISPERITVIPNAHRAVAAGSARDRSTARRELGLPEDVELILQVGRVDPVKCQLALLDAVVELRSARPNLRAWAAGAVGDAGYAARVEERRERSGVGDAFVLLGARTDVDRLLAAADVLAMPSVLEGLSLSVLEALAAGVPVVLTRTGDAAWLLGADGDSERDLPGVLVEGPPIDPLRVEGEELLRLAATDHPPHAAALARGLAAVLDDLEAMRARARRRGRELESAFAPRAVLARYADSFALTAARWSRAAADEARRRASGDRRRAERAAVAHLGLRSALERAAVGFDGALTLARERERAVRRSGALVYELGRMRRELEATASTAEQLLDKLRLGHRIRGAATAALRRLRGG